MGIEIKNLQKSFGEKEVLKGIDFSFDPGKINMIIGASGSGKSVMLKCIVGLMTPTAGQVIYDGLDFHAANHKEVRNFRTNMGMLFQYSALFDFMTVEENIAFPMKLFTKWTKKAIKKRVEFCLDRVNMSGTNHLFPSELSGGMMKRVGIARAIALNPKYLFVDEPNSGLDPLTAKIIDDLIKEITYEFNMCTVVVSHDMNSVVNISDKILFLFNGRKEWQGTKHSILRSGNPNLDKFVFVSDLIRRDIYDDEDEEREKISLPPVSDNVDESPTSEAPFEESFVSTPPVAGVVEKEKAISLEKTEPAEGQVSEGTSESSKNEVNPEVPDIPVTSSKDSIPPETIPEIPIVPETASEVPIVPETTSESSTPVITQDPQEVTSPSDEKASIYGANEDSNSSANDEGGDTEGKGKTKDKSKGDKKGKGQKKSGGKAKRRIHPADAGRIRRKDKPKRPPRK